MSKHKKWVPFPYHTLNYKAAEEWLNQRAEEGWQVEDHLAPLQLIKLARRDGPTVRYCMDLFQPNQPGDADYLSLCRQAGWTPVLELANMRLFVSQPGQRPAPIQTDSGLELERFEATYLWKALRGPLVPLSLLLLLCAAFWVMHFTKAYAVARFHLELARSWQVLVSGVGLALCIASTAWQIVSVVRYWRRGRRAVQAGQPLPVHRLHRTGWWERLRVVGNGLLLIAAIAILVWRFAPSGDQKADTPFVSLAGEPVVQGADVGLSAYPQSALSHEVSPLMRYTGAEQDVLFTSRGSAVFSLDTDHYRCASEGLAHWAVGQLRVSAGSENVQPAFTSVDLGFDESWLWVWEPNDWTPDPQATLVLRQGNTTVRLHGPVDWTDPDIRAMLWERLQLEE